SIVSPSCPCRAGIYLLDLTRGMNQHEDDLKLVITISDTVHINYDIDSKQLFISRCPQCAGPEEPYQSGPSTLSVQSISGGAEHVIYSNPTLGIRDILAISTSTIFFLNGTSRSDHIDLWQVGLDGSRLKHLFTFDHSDFFDSSHFAISDDGNMYAQV